MSIYLELTRAFNAGRCRSIVCSGQAVVLLRLAAASKDGDWILREDQEALDHVLSVLAERGARYRFGAPLDLRWLREGWSSHLELRAGSLRVRTDFFTRPPRLDSRELAELWNAEDGRDPPFTGPRFLARIKMTGREKDWPFVGELARRMEDPAERLLFSQSANDLFDLAHKHPDLVAAMRARRPALRALSDGFSAVEAAIDRERRFHMAADRRRIGAYVEAAKDYAAAWTIASPSIDALELPAAHRALVTLAERCLPTRPPDLDRATSS